MASSPPTDASALLLTLAYRHLNPLCVWELQFFDRERRRGGRVAYTMGLDSVGLRYTLTFVSWQCHPPHCCHISQMRATALVLEFSLSFLFLQCLLSYSIRPGQELVSQFKRLLGAQVSMGDPESHWYPSALTYGSQACLKPDQWVYCSDLNHRFPSQWVFCRQKDIRIVGCLE